MLVEQLQLAAVACSRHWLSKSQFWTAVQGVCGRPNPNRLQCAGETLLLASQQQR